MAWVRFPLQAILTHTEDPIQDTDFLRLPLLHTQSCAFSKFERLAQALLVPGEVGISAQCDEIVAVDYNHHTARTMIKTLLGLHGLW